MKTRTKIIAGTIGVIVPLVISMMFLMFLPRKYKYAEVEAPLVKTLSATLILESMGFGNIAFNTPSSMNLGDTAMIKLLLSLAKPIDELKRMVEAEGEKEGARIKVSDRMEARLSGSNFAITAITPEIQAVSQNEITEWKWEITPKSHGLQSLHLTLSVLLSVDGVSTPRTIKTFDKIIGVEITWSQTATGFLKDNWHWLWATILVPLTGWMWRKLRSNRK